MVPFAIGSSVGSYEILDKLASGGMGDVFRGWDPHLGREVAIKVLTGAFAHDSSRLRRFEREARILATLSHPNVVQIFDVGEQDGESFLVMELVEGSTLRDRLAAGPLPWRQAAELAASVADGLAAAHAKGIIHRDLKPENLMLTVHGHVKILDFGLAKLRQEISSSPKVQVVDGALQLASGVTDPEMVFGTAAYMSPEQVEGARIDHRSDLFSLGVILWEMATGVHPFLCDSVNATMHRILLARPIVTEGERRLPAPLGRILRACLAKKPSDRFRSARELSEALRTLARTDLSTHPIWGSSSRKGISRKQAWLVGFACLLVAAPGGYYAWQRNRKPAPAVAAKAAPGPNVLALPSRIYGGRTDTFLAEAVPNTMSTLLAGVGGLNVKAPPSSAQVDKLNGDLARITEAYQANNLVITSITTRKSRLTLNVQLVDTQTWKILWGHQYEGDQSAYNDMTRAAAEAVARTLTQAANTLPSVSGSGNSSEGDLARSEGFRFSSRYRALNQQDDYNQAVAALERAYALDAHRADAASQLALLHAWRAFRADTDQVGDSERRLSESWARRALERDANCGLAYATLGSLEYQSPNGNPERAIEYALKGACLAPREAETHILLASTCSGPGSKELVIAAGRRSMELDPLNPMGPATTALGLASMRPAEESLALVEQGLRQTPSHSFLRDTVKPYVLVRLGHLKEAEDHFPSTGTVPRIDQKLLLEVQSGQLDAARTTAKRLLESWSEPRVPGRDAAMALCAAPFLVRAGLKEEAILMLEKSVESGRAPCLDWLLTDPDLQLLRGDPRFGRILLAARNGAAIAARHLDQARIRGELPEYLIAPLENLKLQIKMTSQ
ncbi:MAG TPA: protein kinase [Geothrix sp.]|nr:protein kinase [Geothrix sp.]